MAIYAGKLRMQGVDMDEMVPFGVDLFKCFATPTKFIAPFCRIRVRK
jgi:hypothetical protein